MTRYNFVVVAFILTLGGHTAYGQTMGFENGQLVRLPAIDQFNSDNVIRGQSCSDNSCATQVTCASPCDAGCASNACCDPCNACCTTCCVPGVGRTLLDNLHLFGGGDAWGARLDDDDANNFGYRYGLASTLPIGTGGWHAYTGTVLGVYDLLGHDNGDERDNEEQVFVTTGLFRRANANTPWTAGFVIDYLHNENLGDEHNQSVDLYQARYRLGYQYDSRNEFGVWAAHALNTEAYNSSAQGNVNVRAMDQVNAYWERQLDSGAVLMGYLGWLEEPGELVWGVRSEVPISDQVSLYGMTTYGKASTTPGDTAPNGVANSYSEAYWNVGLGAIFYFGGPGPLNSRTVLPVGNNGNFMVQAPVGAL